MMTTLPVYNKNISVLFSRQALRIVNDGELTNLLKQDAAKATDELIVKIKTQYKELFQTEFAVSNSSIAIEIWGHVYASRFVDWIHNLLTYSFVQKLTKKIIYHSAIIDIGEHGHDHNRFVWNWLAPFKKLIASMLP